MVRHFIFSILTLTVPQWGPGWSPRGLGWSWRISTKFNKEIFYISWI